MRLVIGVQLIDRAAACWRLFVHKHLLYVKQRGGLNRQHGTYCTTLYTVQSSIDTVETTMQSMYILSLMVHCMNWIYCRAIISNAVFNSFALLV